MHKSGMLSLRATMAALCALSAVAAGLTALRVATPEHAPAPRQGQIARDGARLVADRLASAVLAVSRDVALAAENALLQPQADPAAIRAYFARWRALHPEYADILLADRTGLIRATASGRFAGAHVSGATWFARGLAGTVIADASERSRAGIEAPRNTILGAPVPGPDRTAIGILAVQLTPEWIGSVVDAARADLGEAGRALQLSILNGTGRPLLQSEGAAGAPAGGPEAVASLPDAEGAGLGWLVAARAPGEAGPTWQSQAGSLLLADVVALAALLGWMVGGHATRGLARLRGAARDERPGLGAERFWMRDLGDLAGTLAEVTARAQSRDRLLHETRAALARARNRLRFIHAVTGATCWEVDFASGQVAWTDAAADRDAGASERVCALDEILSRVAGDDRALVEGAMRGALAAEGVTRDVAVRILPGDGDARERRLILRVAKAARDEVSCTRLHVLSREVAAALPAPGPGLAAENAGALPAPERRRDPLTREIVDSIVHDINNVLTVVLTSVGAARAGHIPDESVRRWLEAAFRGAARGASTTRRVLALSRREAPPAGEIDLAPILDDVLAFLRGTVLAGTPVAVSRAADLPRLHCAERDVEIALLNLAVDIRACLAEGDAVAIVVGASRDAAGAPIRQQAGVQIGVSIGGRLAEGSGIAAVRQLMEEIGGAISVGPSEVTLWIPGSDLAPAQARPGARARARRVLLAEADPLVRSVTADALAGLGHAVTLAATADQAFQALAERRDFDLLLCDHLLPGAKGLHLAAVVSRTHPAMEIVIMGARGQLPANAQVFGSLHKPFGLTELVRALDEAPAASVRAA
ncbi:response regulator [Methylobacterium sp. WSM2598]|uniref:response regulator n=1 Tax=Methylobacterium sp. WSM2598 TaxID=398261 RepID=UPI00036DD54F|nr:response regulator [Methylobacterium sp. WSM2598]